MGKANKPQELLRNQGRKEVGITVENQEEI